MRRLSKCYEECALNAKKDWDRYLPALLFAVREVPQDSLGFSLFKLLYDGTYMVQWQF